MKKLLGSIRHRKGSEERIQTNSSGSNGFTAGPLVPPQGDHPEAVVVREVIAFCESGAPGSQSAGDEYLHLPAIVDGAESSPTAAKEAALCVRRYLSKEQSQRGYAQYNAIMLTRILTDNPGRNFTQNFDKDFVSTVKRLLRDTNDSSVQQILRETLDYFEAQKYPENDSLVLLVNMWRKEKGNSGRLQSQTIGPVGPIGPRPSGRSSRTLPPPHELAGRIEEAKTTARLLLQTLQSTPANELTTNELVTEFGGRATTAQRAIQNYMNCENPRPDDDTMLTLIETNEQLNIATSKYQRALLQARRANSATPSPGPRPEGGSYMGAGEYVYGQQSQQSHLSPPAQVGSGFGRSGSNQDRFVPPAGPPPGALNAVRPTEYGSGATPNGRDAPENPFTDEAGYNHSQNSYSLFAKSNDNSNTTQQPFRPYGNTQPTNSYPQPQDPYHEPTQPRPTGYGHGQPTPSYMHRQESAANNITMHGASPPPNPPR